MFKKLLVVLVVLVVVAIIGVFAALMYVDSLVKSGVEYGGTTATGQNTTLEGASVGLFSGELGLSNLVIANPAGFEGAYFFQLGKVDAALSLKSLMEDTIVVPLIRLDRLELTISRNDEGTNNYDVILDNLKSLSSGSQPSEPTAEPAQKDAKAGRQFIINKLSIENVVVNVNGFPMKVDPVKLPPIVLENIGSGTGKGVVISDLAGIILREVMTQMMKNPGQLPAMALAGLGQGLDGLGGLGDVGLVRVGKVGENVNQLIQGASGDLQGSIGNILGDKAGQGAGQVLSNLGNTGEDALKGQTGQLGEQMDNQLKDVGSSFGNLLGGNKTDEEKKSE